LPAGHPEKTAPVGLIVKKESPAGKRGFLLTAGAD
jgi:hypothetical protein